MNNYSHKYFRESLNQYRANGAESLRGELPKLLEATESPNATKSFLHFVADVCIDLKDYDQSIHLLKSVESKFQLSDVGYNILAFCYWELNQEREAYSAYKQSLSLKADNFSSLRGACFLAIETDHDTEAVEFCRSLTLALPQDREFVIWFATALWNADMTVELKEFVHSREQEFGVDDELREFINSGAK